MHRFAEDLPWWVKWLLIAGGSLMSAFSSKFPDGFQTAGLYLGILIAVLGLAAMIWHGLKDSSRGKMIIGIALMIAGCAIGVLGLSIIASGTSSTAIVAKLVTATGSSFDLGNEIYRETKSIKTTDGRDTKLYETAFYLVVSNNSVDGSTMRNVQAEIVGYETPVVAPIRSSSADKVDLNHGQAGFFLVGKTVGGDFSGNFVGDTTYVPEKLGRYVHNIASGRKPTFEIWSYDNVYRYGLNDDKEKMDWPLTVVISADDRKSKQVALAVRPRDQIPINYVEGK